MWCRQVWCSVVQGESGAGHGAEQGSGHGVQGEFGAGWIYGQVWCRQMWCMQMWCSLTLMEGGACEYASVWSSVRDRIDLK